MMSAKAYLNSCDDASWYDLVRAKTDKSPALVSHFIPDGLKADRVSLLQLSQRSLRLITRYRYNIVAIEAFRR
jgi:hypothetical protein